MPVISSEIISDEELALYQFPTPRTKTMYVDNEKLTSVMVVWSAAVVAAKEAGREIPRMPEYVGECIYLIATNIARKGNFRDYSWIDEMIADGIEACCKYLHNWRPEAATRKGAPNPYGYISKIVEQEFRHRIELEKRQDYYKNKSLLNMGGPEAFEGEDWGDAAGAETANNMMRDMVNRAYEYEEKQAERAANEKAKQAAQKKSKPTLLDLFSVPDEDEECEDE